MVSWQGRIYLQSILYKIELKLIIYIEVFEVYGVVKVFNFFVWYCYCLEIEQLLVQEILVFIFIVQFFYND